MTENNADPSVCPTIGLGKINEIITAKLFPATKAVNVINIWKKNTLTLLGKPTNQ